MKNTAVLWASITASGVAPVNDPSFAVKRGFLVAIRYVVEGAAGKSR